MVLLTKKSVFFILLINTFCLTKFSKGLDEFSSDSDDDQLQQALLLVDILKAEYSRALHENSILRSNANNSSDELSTCAPTEEGNFTLPFSGDERNDTVNISNIASVSPSALPSQESIPPGPSPVQPPQPGLWSPLLQQQQQPIQPYPQQGLYPPQPMHNLQSPLPIAPQYYATQWPPNYSTQYADRRQMPYGAYRRMMPRDYFYYDMNRYNNNNNARLTNMPFYYRRMENNAVKENATTSTARIIPTQVTISHKPHTVAKKTSGTPKARVTKTQSHKKKLKQPITNRKTLRKNPILDQVAKELINEIGVSKSSKKAKSNTKIHGWRKPVLRSNSETTKNQTAFTRTTLRVHMEKSTKLALPLSENNAYCFFSPRSALCRSAA